MSAVKCAAEHEVEQAPDRAGPAPRWKVLGPLRCGLVRTSFLFQTIVFFISLSPLFFKWSWSNSSLTCYRRNYFFVQCLLPTKRLCFGLSGSNFEIPAQFFCFSGEKNRFELGLTNVMFFSWRITHFWICVCFYYYVRSLRSINATHSVPKPCASRAVCRQKNLPWTGKMHIRCLVGRRITPFSILLFFLSLFRPPDPSMLRIPSQSRARVA